MGSKNKIAKYILPHILKNKNPDGWYVEPFCGGCNSLDKVEGKRIGNDNNVYLIEMWKSLQNGWTPPNFVSKEIYYEVKKNQNNLHPALVGFVSFLCSFGGKWWGGYAKNAKGDNYADIAVRCLKKQIENLKDVIFTSGDYQNLIIPPNSTIYCDIPYKGTTKYKDNFNYEIFWDWCRGKTSEGHNVYISEYVAPSDFKCLVEVEHKTILDKNSQYPRLEKLFVYESVKND